MMYFKNFKINYRNRNKKQATVYKPISYKNKFYIFQASDSILRNLIFPNSGWPKKDFPKMKIISTPGNHASILDGKNSIFLSNELKKILAAKGIA